jgi:ankyrin repeat protein
MSNLITATISNDIVEFTRIIIQNDNEIDAQNPNGITALMFACMNGNFLMVQILYNRGANLNITNDRRQTALIVAIECNQPDIMMFLINAGTSLNIVDIYGNTAHYYYMMSTSIDIHRVSVPEFNIYIENNQHLLNQNINITDTTNSIHYID